MHRCSLGMERFEFNGSNVADCPLPTTLPSERGRKLDKLAQESQMRHHPPSVAQVLKSATALQATRAEICNDTRAQMIAMQEELDWEVIGCTALSMKI